jgi:hypothetical protein
MADSACSSVSLALGEPLAATASEATAWLLVEQPGGWGRKALVESELDRAVGADIEKRAKELGIKALLVKRPGRDTSARGPRTVMLGWSEQGAAWLERTSVDRASELGDLDLERLAAGRRGAGVPVAGPVYLVCTNGRRDACCAALGRPVAAALDAARPGRVWECSHLGGHRFAANVVCLPDGLLLGRVTPADTEAIAAAYESGRVPLEHLRGRSAYPPPAQAAEALVRAREGLEGLDDLVLDDVTTDDGTAIVTFTATGTTLRARLRSERPGPGRPYSCGADELESPLVWTLAGLDRVG